MNSSTCATSVPGAPVLTRLDDSDEREDPVPGHEGADRRQRAHDFDAARVEADFLVGLAQGGRAQVLVRLVLASSGE